MFEKRDLEAARKAGVIDGDTLSTLENFLDKKEGPGAPADPETLRFLANFNDVFISIGLVILAFGLSAASGMFLGASGSFTLIIAPVLAAFWLLLEYFAGRRRLLLPSMTLSVFVVFLTMLLAAGIGSGVASGVESGLRGDFDTRVFARGVDIARDFGLWASGGAMLASGAIFARFRLPFSLFLFAIAVAVGIYTLAASFGDMGAILGGTVSFLIGLGTLAVAIGFDARDPARKSLSSDNAFWLHFAAAPQIMLGLRGMLTGSGFEPAGAGEATTLLIALAFFSVISLALNRRALIAAALLSFWLAIGVLVESAGGSEFSTVTWSLLLLGGSIVLLGGGWSTARRLILAIVPRHGVFARIFPPEPA
ncbi:MAG: hypothetical protein AAF683_09310 [Pseudomonadota bacterium]